MNRELFHDRCARRTDLFQQKRLVDQIMHDTRSGRTSDNGYQVKYPILIRVIQDNPAISSAVFDALAELGLSANKELAQVEKLLGIDPD